MNLRTTYIDNCKLKKIRNRLMGYSVKKNEIGKQNLYLHLIIYYEYFYQGFAIY